MLQSKHERFNVSSVQQDQVVPVKNSFQAHVRSSMRSQLASQRKHYLIDLKEQLPRQLPKTVAKP